VSRPHGIAVRYDGEVILADTGNGRVGRFQGDGSFENTVGAYDLAEPRGVVWAGGDEVAVSDREGGTVRIFSAEGSAEPWEGEPPAFVAPSGLTYDAANRTYVVADEGRNSVVFFMDNRGSPVFIRSVENVVGDAAGLSRPVDVVKSNSPVDDIYYVADNGNGRIVKIILPEEDEEGPKEVWEDLRTALMGEDMEDALQFFSPRTRDVYRELLMSIGGNVDVLISDMGDLLPLRITRDRAVYGMLRYDNGKPYLFDVVFARDGRGDWKIVNW